MSLGRYLAGVLLLGVCVGALGFGAHRVRRRLLPTWSGALGVIVDVVGLLGALILVADLLGTVRGFDRWWLTATYVAVGVGSGLWAGPPPTRAPERRMPGSSVSVPTLVSLGIAATVFAQWTAHVVAAYQHGIRDGDSLWYHLPFATAFAQTGWTTRPLFTNADTLVTYFPANSETVNAVTMSVIGRDVLVPAVCLGWLALAMLGGWCIGRRYGAPAIGLAAVAMIASVPVFAGTQAGTARNDIVTIALFLATVAIVVEARWNPVALAFAGVAGGLALGVKLSAVPAVVFLAIGVLVVAPAARRRAIVVPWLGSLVLFGGYWYIRNLARVGNPLPWVGVDVGPLSLPTVYAKSVSDSAVFDRFGESDAFSRVLHPGLRYAFGWSWWFTLLFLAAVVVLVLARGPDRLTRMLAVVAGLTVAAYVMMPNGTPDSDSAFGARIFGLNLRYAFAGLVLAAVLTAALPRMRDTRVALGAVGLLGFMVVVQIFDREFEDHYEWAVDGSQRIAAWILVIAAVVVLAVLWQIRGRRGLALAIGIGVAALAIAFGYSVQQAYFDDRYAEPIPEAHSSPAWTWAQQLQPARIGLVGDLMQYPYTGPELASTVRYVGVETDDGGFREARACREWLRALADGRFDYLVTSVDLVGSNARMVERFIRWTQTIPGTEQVFSAPPAAAFRLGGVPDPDACP